MSKINWKQILILVGNIFSALFLTILIDTVTLTTYMHKIFVFGYFYIILFIIMRIVIKQQINWKKSLLVISVVFSVSFIKIGGFDNYYKCVDLEIFPIGKMNEEANGEEVWIKDIVVDGISIFNSNDYNFSGWYEDDDSGYLVSYNEEKTEPICISVEYVNDYKIVFVEHQWAGAVKILLNGEEKLYDLYADEGQDIEKIYEEEYARRNLSGKNILIMIGGFILFFQIVYSMFIFATKRNVEIATCALLCSIGIFADDLCKSITFICITILGVTMSWIIKQDLGKTKFLGKYKNYNIAIVMLALYSAFSIIGRKTIIYKEKNNISYFYVFFLCIIVILGVLVLLEKIRTYKVIDYTPVINIKKIRGILILKNIIIALVCSFMIISFLDDYIIKKYQESEIVIQALGELGENEKGREVLLDSIRINGKVVEIDDYVTPTGGWKAFGSNSYIYNNSEKISNIYLNFPAERKIELYFYNYSVGGKAEIIDGSNRKIIDFSTNNKNYSNNFYIYEVKSNIIQKNYFLNYFILGVLLFSIQFIVFTLYDNWIYKKDLSYQRIYARFLFWKIWVFIFCGLNIVIYAYFPGNWSWDILYQWGQATHMVALSDGHPIILTLFLRLVLGVYKHPYMFVESLIILVSTTFSGIASYFVENGIKKRTFYFLTLLIVLSPAIIIMVSNPLKDSFHMCFMALTIFYIYVIIKKAEYLKRLYYFVGLCASLFFIGQLRHEAILSAIVCSIIITILALKNKKYFLIGIVALSAILSVSFNSYKAKLVQSNSVNTGINTILLNDISRVLYDGKKLTTESEELLEMYLPLERWKELYDPFDRDELGFDSEYKAAIEKNREEITTFKVFKCYLRELLNHPLSIILSRLDAVNDIWYVGINEESNTFYGIDGIMTFYCVGPKELGVPENEEGIYRANNILSKFVKPFITFTEENILFNRIFLNTGIAILGCLIMILYLCKNNRSLIILSIPILVRIITMALLSGWQHFRYYYSIRLMCIVFIVICILDNYSKKNNTFNISTKNKI